MTFLSRVILSAHEQNSENIKSITIGEFLSPEWQLQFKESIDTIRELCPSLEEKLKNKEQVSDLKRALPAGIISGVADGGISEANIVEYNGVVGVDIDATAVKTAIENGRLNGMEEPRYRMTVGNLADAVSGTYSVVVANIVADAIKLLSPDVPRFLAPNGVYLVSGIIDTRETDVTEALTACGFAIVDRKERGGWLCLTTKRASEV